MNKPDEKKVLLSGQDFPLRWHLMAVGILAAVLLVSYFLAAYSFLGPGAR